ncbi:MAG TPA: tetratricopeptide repeat protein, partial [Pyrinomonadaceae bacterium]|nr:tetratricopeptide repeat protein [Pyrinomonadaceae bacterium]
MMQHKLSALALAAALLCAPFTSALAFAPTASNAPGSVAFQQDDTPPDIEQAMFTKGQNFYNQGRFEQAANTFRDFLKTYPNSIITDLTLLWLGRTYIAQNRLSDAEGIVPRLRTLKDTPFIEIYEGELQAARSEMIARGATPQPTATPAATARAQATPNRPTSRVPAATPTPTPVARLVGRSNAPRTRATPLPTPLPTPSATPQVARATPPSRMPTLRIENTPTNANMQTSAPVVRPSRRNTRTSRRTQPQRTTTDTQV